MRAGLGSLQIDCSNHRGLRLVRSSPLDLQLLQPLPGIKALVKLLVQLSEVGRARGKPEAKLMLGEVADEDRRRVALRRKGVRASDPVGGMPIDFDRIGFVGCPFNRGSLAREGPPHFFFEFPGQRRVERAIDRKLKHFDGCIRLG